MEDDILDKLWESRKPYDALFLKIIDGCDRLEDNRYIYYKKQDVSILTYYKYSRTISIKNLFFSEFYNGLDMGECTKMDNLIKFLINKHLNIDNVSMVIS